MRYLRNLIFKSLLVLLIILFSCVKVYAKNDKDNVTSSDVEAVVDLSVCGDGVVEGGEECDEEDLNQKTCKKLGYDDGDLLCDLACEFDVTNCSLVEGTPSPTSQSETTSVSSSNNSSSESIQKQIKLALNILKKIDSKLNLIQSHFDFDSSGKVEVYELYDTVKAWVDEWKLQIEVAAIAPETVVKVPEKCDLDNNGVCNIIDLSILLYYIER